MLESAGGAVAQTGGCEGFRVGSRQWTECVHDQATGGGLMPWIVVIPLGVMVLGMMVGFARQFSSAGRRRAQAHGAAGTAGTWLIFVSFVELAIGVGNVIAARRAPGEGGGYAISAIVLLGVGILLFLIGVFLKIKGYRRSRIFHSGVPGEAVIRAVHETGTMVNNQPMYAFDLEVTGQGFAPVTTRHREVIPFWFLNRIGPQSRVPVKVDPSNPTRVIFDWDSFAATTPAGAGVPGNIASTAAGVTSGEVAGAAQRLMPDPESIAQAMQTAQQYAGRGGWHAGKVIGLAITLFILAVVGGGLFIVARVFGEVSDVTSNVSDQVSDALDDVGGLGGLGGGGGGGGAGTTIEVSRTASGRAPVKFTLTLPVGWVDVTAAVPERQGGVLVDVVLKPQTPSEGRIVVTRSMDYMQNPAPAGAGIATVRKDLEKEFGDALVRSKRVELAGEEGLQLEIAAGADGLRSRQMAVMREGQIIFVGLTAPKAEFEGMLEVFDRLLASWNWGTVSA